MTQHRVQKPRNSTKESIEAPATQSSDTQVKSKTDAAKIKGEIDDLLDEIDGVLEENAAEFVAAYVQKGGQ